MDRRSTSSSRSQEDLSLIDAASPDSADYDRRNSLGSIQEDGSKTKPNKPKHVMLDFANVMKSFIGSNFLGLPFAFANAGIFGGLASLALVSLVTGFCCLLLVRLKRQLVQMDSTIVGKSYGSVIHAVFGTPGTIIVDILLIFTQFGFCIGYFIFISQNLANILPASTLDETDRSLIAIAIPVALVLPLVFIKKMKRLGFISLIADVLLLGGVAIFLSYDRLEKAHEVVAIRWESLALTFGMLSSAFEGSALFYRSKMKCDQQNVTRSF